MLLFAVPKAKWGMFTWLLDYEVERIDVSQLPCPHTKIMMNVGSPEAAFKEATIPNDGVGLARMEFIFATWIKVHPLALLTRFATLPESVRQEVEAVTAGYTDKREFFIDRLAQGVGTLAAAFYPKPVILRLSDFKTNEYAHLVGGQAFEPSEANPMIGWRGASRYYHPDYQEGFLLEIEAIKKVRDRFGLKNLLVMVPFCRTPEEGQKVLDVMAAAGLPRWQGWVGGLCDGGNSVECDLAHKFSQTSMVSPSDSNDLTQLVLGVDRDSTQIAALFDERNLAVQRACAELIEVAHRYGRKVGICGQAPSDYPEFAAFLVGQGIDSISLTPDVVMRTTSDVLELERKHAAPFPAPLMKSEAR